MGSPRGPLLLPLLSQPGGATLLSLVSAGSMAKSPANNAARPRVKFSSSDSAWTIACNRNSRIDILNV